MLGDFHLQLNDEVAKYLMHQCGRVHHEENEKILSSTIGAKSKCFVNGQSRWGAPVLVMQASNPSQIQTQNTSQPQLFSFRSLSLSLFVLFGIFGA